MAYEPDWYASLRAAKFAGVPWTEALGCPWSEWMELACIIAERGEQEAQEITEQRERNRQRR